MLVNLKINSSSIKKNLEKIWALRRELSGMSEVEGMKKLIELTKLYKNNDELLENLILKK